MAIISDQVKSENENLFYRSDKFKLKFKTIENSLDKNFSYNKEFLKIAHNLQKAVKHLHVVDINYLFLIKDFDTKRSNLDLINMFRGKTVLIPLVLYINSKNKYNLEDIDFDKFLNKNDLFYNCVDHENTFKTYHYILDVKTLKVLTASIQNEVDIIITKNIYKGKESRWLLKNTLLSHDFVSKTFITTNLKKLYNNHTININSRTRNLWVSNRLKRTKDYVHTTLIENNIYLPTLKNSFLSKPHLSYLDKIESGFY